jgi:hypothetical protein
MQIRFTDKMLKTIAKHVHEARMTRGILDVYKAAETIRLENIDDNVAREDIIEKLVHLAGMAFVPVEFNKHSFDPEGAFYDTPIHFAVGLQENQSVH